MLLSYILLCSLHKLWKLMFTSQINSIASYFVSCQQSHTRAALRLIGTIPWQIDVIKVVAKRGEFKKIVQLGGESMDVEGVLYLAATQGKQLLGQESDLLLVYLDQQFDANSFNAAIGSLVGGGAVIFVCSGYDKLLPWLSKHLESLPCLHQEQSKLTIDSSAWMHCKIGDVEWSERFAQQTQAIAMIEKVLFGHRKRPLVITADRGRGKSSSLGLALRSISTQRSCNALITAPSRAAVAPVFEHFDHQDPKISLQFIAPDDLLVNQPECDLLLIDEAAAIPVAMLKKMIERYHRVVISTTIHGYEGCGRGFSLKFIPWLRQVRPDCKLLSMQQPIRWAQRDPLERWCADTFLLNSELLKIEPSETGEYLTRCNWHFSRYHNNLDDESDRKLRQAFALLVNAHYQTSPNDLMLLLANQNMQLYTLESKGAVIGSVLVNIEGNLTAGVVDKIMLGQSRPQGHLIPSDLSNHLGLVEPGLQRCGRIMRIAVHPLLQQKGIGSVLVRELVSQLSARVDYLGTAFGATASLLQFWFKNKFVAARLGSSRDKASGTYSVSMVMPLSGQANPWVVQAETMLYRQLPYQFSLACKNMDIDTVWALFSSSFKPGLSDTHLDLSLLTNYSLGGNSLDTSRPYLIALLGALVEKGILVDSDLLKVIALQQLDIQQACVRLGHGGKRHAETQLRQDIAKYLFSLQCKSV